MDHIPSIGQPQQPAIVLEQPNGQRLMLPGVICFALTDEALDKIVEKVSFAVMVKIQEQIFSTQNPQELPLSEGDNECE